MFPRSQLTYKKRSFIHLFEGILTPYVWFDTKICLIQNVYIFWTLVCFYGISNIEGYLVPNSFLYI